MLCYVASQQGQELATPDTGSDTISVKAKPTPNDNDAGGLHKKVLKKDLKSFTVRNQDEFEQGLRKIGMGTISFGGNPFNLSRLARKTVDVILRTRTDEMKGYHKELEHHKKAEKDHRQQTKWNIQAGEDVDRELKRNVNKWRRGHPKPKIPREVVTEGQSWQIMFNLITYIFRPAQMQVPTMARALSNPSAEIRIAAASSNLYLPSNRGSKNIQDLDEKHTRQEAATSSFLVSDDVDGGKGVVKDSQITKYEEEFEKIKHGFMVWINQEIRTPLTKIYITTSNYRLYSKMTTCSSCQRKRNTDISSN